MLKLRYIKAKDVKTKSIKNTFTLFSLITIVYLAFSLSACSDGMVNHAPVKGDYGQTIVHEMQLSAEQIKQLNSPDLPKPYNKQSDKQKIYIEFTADGELNPYRVVFIAKGKANSYNQVDVRFAGILHQLDSYGGRRGTPTPQVYKEEDTHKYRVSQQAILAIASEPFSFNASYAPEKYIIKAGLTKQENFTFESVNIQIWQGIGTQESSYSYYKFLIVIMIAGLFVYRMFKSRLM